MEGSEQFKKKRERKKEKERRGKSLLVPREWE